MVRNYKRKTDRAKWEEDDMRRAVNVVISEKMGFLRASSTYNVPKSTLERRVKKARIYNMNEDTDSDPDFGKKSLGRYKTVFSKEQENELSQYIKSMEARLFGLTGKELRILAYQLAERNNIEHPFNAETGMAGEDWLSGFLKRHPDLTYRRPEPTSAARAMGFNKVAVSEFFTLLEEVVDKHSLTPDRIYNVDETGISTVPKSQSKVLSLKGQKQVGCLSSAERGQLVTAEICFNAAGTYVPPMLIYARKRMKNELLDDAPSGFWGTCSDNGWITSKIFFDWFQSFVNFSKPTKEKPVLLLLDGHASHTKNIELIDYARENNVILLCTPPHCTHKLQPLDVSFMRPLSTYYSAEVKKWLREHPGRVVTPYQVAKLFGNAYLQAATMLTAINGFKKCGIWPVDRNVFTEADFLTADTTDTKRIVTDEDLNATTTTEIPTRSIALTSDTLENSTLIQDIQNPTTTETFSQPSTSTSANLKDSTPTNACDNAVPNFGTSSQSIPSTSNLLENFTANDINNKENQNPTDIEMPFQPIIASTSAISETEHFTVEKPKTPEKQMANFSFLVSPANIVAIPKEIRTTERKTRKRGKTTILTASPYKNELKTDLENKIKKNKNIEQKTENKKLYKKTKTKIKIIKNKKKCNKPNKTKTKKSKEENETDTDSSKEEDGDDCACIYCGYLYSQSTEGWVVCSVCHGWAHNSCAGVDEEDDDAHICERCQPD